MSILPLMADRVLASQIYRAPSQGNLMRWKRLSPFERYQIYALMKAVPTLKLPRWTDGGERPSQKPVSKCDFFEIAA